MRSFFTSIFSLARPTSEVDQIGADSTSDDFVRRFQRFFASCALPARHVGALILALAPKPADGWVLAMDRTNWRFGKTHVNLLVVTVILNGVGLPIAWKMLPKTTKSGNSRHGHRIALIGQVLSILPAATIRALTMDRGFVGKRRLGWLTLMEVPYIVRVKANTRIGSAGAAWWCGRNRWKRHAVELHTVFGRKAYFAAKRIHRGRDPFLAVISGTFRSEEALELYRMRWGIETFFGHPVPRHIVLHPFGFTPAAKLLPPPQNLPGPGFFREVAMHNHATGKISSRGGADDARKNPVANFLQERNAVFLREFPIQGFIRHDEPRMGGSRQLEAVGQFPQPAFLDQVHGIVFGC